MNKKSGEGPYGFYCPQTNMFYCVESQEIYEELLSFLEKDLKGKAQEGLKKSQSNCDSKNEGDVDINQIYMDMVDKDIEEAHTDSYFTKEIEDPELK